MPPRKQSYDIHASVRKKGIEWPETASPSETAGMPPPGVCSPESTSFSAFSPETTPRITNGLQTGEGIEPRHQGRVITPVNPLIVFKIKQQQ